MKYCLIGEKLSHSKSKEIHEFSGFKYDLVEVGRGKLGDFIKNCDYDGFNVTIPYKKEIIPYLDEIDGSAKEIGAVNTVARENGRLKGYNTDFFGMKYMLCKAGISLQGKEVLILGTGGTSETAKAVAKDGGAKRVNAVSRTGEINYGNCYNLKDTAVIINATPVGMYPNINEKPIDLKRFLKLEGVADCIYNPKETLLIKEGISLGLKSVGGLYMLVAQGVKSEEIWTGKKFDNGLIDRLYEFLESKI